MRDIGKEFSFAQALFSIKPEQNFFKMKCFSIFVLLVALLATTAYSLPSSNGQEKDSILETVLSLLNEEKAEIEGEVEEETDSEVSRLYRAINSSTVEPPINDPPNKGQSLNNGYCMVGKFWGGLNFQVFHGSSW